MSQELLSLPRDVGPFRLELLLGRGGMGEVYKARDRRLERSVAVKRLLAEDGSAAVARERFRREARTLAGLGHPAIVQLYDLLEHQGELWIVMELVDGATLSQVLRQGPLDVAQVLDTSLQIASALASAHQAGVLHLDLKTDNVMVSRGSSLGVRQVKVLDFGVARPIPPRWPEVRTLSEPTETLGPREALAGTPRAMSPEQARGELVGERSDLFSLGALIYELLTGSSPFGAASVTETLVRVMTHRPPPVSELDATVPRTLSALIDQLLEKAPERRPKSAAAVVHVLRNLPLDRARPRWGRRPSALFELPGPIDETPTTLPPLDHEAVKTLVASELLGAENLLLELGDREGAALLEGHDRQMRDLLAAHGGIELEKSGATLLLLFDRPLPAVRFALAYHEALRKPTDAARFAREARLAVHLGEVVLRRNRPSDIARGARPLEVEGLAKLTTKRLLALAAAGQTVLTRPATEMAKRASVGKGDLLEWISQGHRQEGLAEPVELFEVRLARAAPPLVLAVEERTRTERRLRP